MEALKIGIDRLVSDKKKVPKGPLHEPFFFRYSRRSLSLSDYIPILPLFLEIIGSLLLR